jgi:hypothetical protein
MLSCADVNSGETNINVECRFPFKQNLQCNTELYGSKNDEELSLGASKFIDCIKQ